MAIALIVDAGPLYAYVDEDDRQHEASLALLETHPGPVALAERLGESVLATLDRRHFTVVRPKHVISFELLP